MNHLIAAKTDMETARAYWTKGRGEAERAFRGARRHSRIVRSLRIAVPAAVALMLGGVVLVQWFNPMRMLSQLPINISDLVVSGSKITMQAPKLSGFTRDSRAYEMTATAAAQDITRPDMVELSNLRAKVQMRENNQMEMSADKGLYDTKGETLKLNDNVVISSSTGYQGWLSEAMVDIRKGNVVSEKPVQVKMLQGTLNSNRLEVFESGVRVVFEGDVKMTLMLNQSAAPSESKAETR